MINDNLEQIVFASGCFWCTEAVFQRVIGVHKVVSGYTGGSIKNPAYREVCSGRTGHAEGILVSFDTGVITLQELLEIFFATHDPTTLNRQGHDVGSQYRSAIFFTLDTQKVIIDNYISYLTKEQVFDKPIVTQVSRLDVFYEAEEDHQNYYNDNQLQPYCNFVISPKVQKLKKNFANKLK